MSYCYRIEGRVQGVAFRYHTRNEAVRLGIRGTVRNLPDGSVEIYADAAEETIRQFEFFLKSSPGHSEVKKISKNKVETEFREPEFLIIY